MTGSTMPEGTTVLDLEPYVPSHDIREGDVAAGRFAERARLILERAPDERSRPRRRRHE